MKKYAIVCGSRSGSSYLCKLLTATNRCGKPDEFFNSSLHYPKDRHQLIKKYTTANDVFGVKIVGLDQWQNYINSQLQISHWIWLRREDEVLQAISRYIAYTTNGWHRQTAPPEYSAKGIQWCLDEIKKENAFYQEFFDKTPHLELTYEYDVDNNSVSTVISILNYLDISLEDMGGIYTTQKKVNHINQQWKRKFNEETATKVGQPE